MNRSILNALFWPAGQAVLFFASVLFLVLISTQVVLGQKDSFSLVAQKLDDTEAAKYPFVAVRNKAPSAQFSKVYPAISFPLTQKRSVAIVPKSVPTPESESSDWYIHDDLDVESNFQKVHSQILSRPFLVHQMGQTRFEIDSRDLPKLIPAPISSYQRGRRVELILAVPRNEKIEIEKLSGKISNFDKEFIQINVETEQTFPDETVAIAVDQKGRGLGVFYNPLKKKREKHRQSKIIDGQKFSTFYDLRLPRIQNLVGFWRCDHQGNQEMELSVITDRPVPAGTSLEVLNDEADESSRYRTKPLLHGVWSRAQKDRLYKANAKNEIIEVSMQAKLFELSPGSWTDYETRFQSPKINGLHIYKCRVPVKFDDYRYNQILIGARMVLKSENELVETNIVGSKLFHLSEIQLPLIRDPEFWKDPYKGLRRNIKTTRDRGATPPMDDWEGPEKPNPIVLLDSEKTTGKADSNGLILLKSVGKNGMELNAANFSLHGISLYKIAAMVVSADETVAWVMDREQNIVRIELPTLKATHFLETKLNSPSKERNYFCLSNQGLMIGDERGFFLLDPDSLKTKKWCSVPNMNCITSSPNSKLAFASSEPFFSVFDLETGKRLYQALGRIEPHPILSKYPLENAQTSESARKHHLYGRHQKQFEGKDVPPDYSGATMKSFKLSLDGQYLFVNSICLMRFKVSAEGELEFEGRSPYYRDTSHRVYREGSSGIWISGDGQSIASYSSNAMSAERMAKKFGPGTIDFLPSGKDSDMAVEVFRTNDLSKPFKTHTFTARSRRALTFIDPINEFVFEGKNSIFGNDTDLHQSQWLPKTKRWLVWGYFGPPHKLSMAIAIKEITDVEVPPTATVQ